ncbi:DNA alkylation repair protein [Candidatus Omnitrophota bacterium]
MSLNKIKQTLKSYASNDKAKILQSFFKTGKGEYGEGDVFVGVSVPDIRKVAKEYQCLKFSDIKILLRSKIHEERLLALLILVFQFNKGSESQKTQIYDIYLNNTRYINNWDLVDLSSHEIVGSFLLKKSKKDLYRLSKSKLLWDRRISIVATYAFIRSKKLQDTFKIAKTLLNDQEDLIHKAVGWMLREAGKRSTKDLEAFLKKHYKRMPRTMLRYSIEKFPEAKRQKYLKGKIKSIRGRFSSKSLTNPLLVCKL